MSLLRFARRQLPLLLTAAFAITWIVARVCLQSVTIDEADSYLGFVAPSWNSYWLASSGNHVLNSILTRLLIGLFGLSELTLRGPAINGAIVYIAAAYRICILLFEKQWQAGLLFVCFVHNPLVMDFLVAARGYSLALGFFTAALSILTTRALAGGETGEPDALRYLVAASIFAALSFTANFAFAYADGACVLMLLILEARRRLTGYLRLAAAAIVPGIAVVLPICGSVLQRWPKGN
jgi:hypothetical protein